MELRLIIMALICLCIAQLAFAEDAFTFKSLQEQQRFVDLSKQFRCIVCPNQNLFDSNSESAQDMRGQVYELINNGHSDLEIRRSMTQQYGDYVLYKPAFNLTTSVLWLGPGIILGLAGVMTFFTLRSKQ